MNLGILMTLSGELLGAKFVKEFVFRERKENVIEKGRGRGIEE